MADLEKNILVVIPVNEDHKKFLEEKAASGDKNCCIRYVNGGEVTKEDVEQADVIVGNVDPSLISGAKNLELLQLNSAGADLYIKAGVMPEGAVLTNATGAYGLAVSEHMLGLTFDLIRRLNQYHANQAEHVWKAMGNIISVEGSTILVLGLGDIGGDYARKVHALGAHVIGVRRTDREKPDYLDEQEIVNVREQYPELIDSNGEIVWNDPDFMKRGVTFDVENFGEKYKLELVCDSYLDNGSLYVGAYDVTPESDNFGERWADISVNLNNPCQNDRTVFLDMNNLYNPAIIEAIYGLGTVEGIVSHSGFCSYPAFTFDADVISQMRNTQEFMDANTPDDYKLVAVKVGYNFALVPKIELSGIETNATETIVDISGKQYGLLAGRTFEDSQKLDAVLDAFPEYAIKDYKVPNKISVFIMPVQMYWKDDPSEIIETNFSFEDTCGLAIDDSVTFSGYTQNELVDMIGREDNGEDFVITGVGAGHYVGTCKKEPSKNKSVSEKTCNARESSGRLDADRNVDRNDIAKDKEVK